MKEKKLNKKLRDEYEICRNVAKSFKKNFEHWVSVFATSRNITYQTVSNDKYTEYTVKFFDPIDDLIKTFKSAYAKHLDIKEGLFDIIFSIYPNDINGFIIRLNLE